MFLCPVVSGLARMCHCAMPCPVSDNWASNMSVRSVMAYPNLPALLRAQAGRWSIASRSMTLSARLLPP